jgi:hypothetical protein
MINPVVEDNGMVYYGKSGENIKAIYGIEPSNFIKIHQRLVEQGLIVEFPDASSHIVFSLYCNELLKMGFDLSKLLSEYNSSQKHNFEELKHALSLTKICYHYHKAGIQIEVERTKARQSAPDLVVNGVTCDLKVRHDQIYKRLQSHRNLVQSGIDEDYHRIFFDSIRSLQKDLESALENRLSNQAQCFIFDLSDHFHSWNYHRIKSYLSNKTINGISTEPIKAIPGVCIIFSPDNAMNLNSRGFYPRAFWGYVLYDVQKREIINNSS